MCSGLGWPMTICFSECLKYPDKFVREQHSIWDILLGLWLAAGLSQLAQAALWGCYIPWDYSFPALQIETVAPQQWSQKIDATCALLTTITHWIAAIFSPWAWDRTTHEREDSRTWWDAAAGTVLVKSLAEVWSQRCSKLKQKNWYESTLVWGWWGICEYLCVYIYIYMKVLLWK